MKLKKNRNLVDAAGHEDLGAPADYLVAHFDLGGHLADIKAFSLPTGRADRSARWHRAGLVVQFRGAHVVHLEVFGPDTRPRALQPSPKRRLSS